MSNLSPAHIDALLIANLVQTTEGIWKSIDELASSSKIAAAYIQSGLPYSGTFQDVRRLHQITEAVSQLAASYRVLADLRDLSLLDFQRRYGMTVQQFVDTLQIE